MLCYERRFAYTVRYKTTMENEKIPEKRRPFVAAMDMASGIVTAVAQLVVGFAIASPKVQNKLWDSMFKNAQFKNIGAARKSFTTILALIGSGVITERILVPLLATPLAAKMEKKFFKTEDGETKYPLSSVLKLSKKPATMKVFIQKADEKY